MAEIVAAFPDVEVAVADAGRFHLEQHLGARRLRRRMIDLFQRRVELGDLETLHRFSPGFSVIGQTLPRLFWRDKRASRYSDQRMMASHELPRCDRAKFRH